jgi:hypothetical protein
MRPNSWDKFSHLSDIWLNLYVDKKLPLEHIAALGFGADQATIRRYLISAGVKMRPCNVTIFHKYISPSAGQLRLRGAWELAYAQVLDIWFRGGLISSWSYETKKVPLTVTGKWYLPDFVVTQKCGNHVIHEVKGYLWEKSAAKLAEVRSLGVPIVLVTGRILSCLCAHYRIPFAVKTYRANV